MSYPHPMDDKTGFADEPYYRPAAHKIALLCNALNEIADIAEGSTTANSLPHIAKIARKALTP